MGIRLAAVYDNDNEFQSGNLTRRGRFVAIEPSNSVQVGPLSHLPEEALGRLRLDLSPIRESSDVVAADVRGADIREVVEKAARGLKDHLPVVIGFECPLFVPIRRDPRELTSARRGDGNRPWSATAGAGSLATGLTEVVWILRELRNRVGPGVQAFLSWQEFVTTDTGLFLWEEFVSRQAPGHTHEEDAAAAVRSFSAALPDLTSANAIHEPEVHSLIGAAMLRTGWSDQLAVLETPSVVIKG